MESRWVLLLLLLALGLSAAALIAGIRLPVPVVGIYVGYLSPLVILAPHVATAGFGLMLVRAVLLKLKRPMAEYGRYLTIRFGSADRLIGTLGPILFVPLLMAGFGTLKQIMPFARPFTWDDTVAEIGRLLCFGYRPWQITHALLGSPAATLILDRIYTAWVGVLSVAVLGFALFAPLQLRARFFVAFGLAWLLIGVAGAYFFASAGPCYSARIGAASAPGYAELMARLWAIDAAGYRLNSVHWQEHLWSAYQHRIFGFGLGISAMPSMHNAMCMLYVLAARRASPLVQVGVWLFALAILIGSVHLGWHYLVDGLFAWAAAAALWWVAGRYLRWVNYVPETHGRSERAEALALRTGRRPATAA